MLVRVCLYFEFSHCTNIFHLFINRMISVLLTIIRCTRISFWIYCGKSYVKNHCWRISEKLFLFRNYYMSVSLVIWLHGWLITKILIQDPILIVLFKIIAMIFNAIDFIVSNWWNDYHNTNFVWFSMGWTRESIFIFFEYCISIKFSAIQFNTICCLSSLLLYVLLRYILFLSFCHQLVLIKTTARKKLHWKPIQHPNQNKGGINRKKTNKYTCAVVYYDHILYSFSNP